MKRLRSIFERKSLTSECSFSSIGNFQGIIKVEFIPKEGEELLILETNYDKKADYAKLCYLLNVDCLNQPTLEIDLNRNILLSLHPELAKEKFISWQIIQLFTISSDLQEYKESFIKIEKALKKHSLIPEINNESLFFEKYKNISLEELYYRQPNVKFIIKDFSANWPLSLTYKVLIKHEIKINSILDEISIRFKNNQPCITVNNVDDRLVEYIFNEDEKKINDKKALKMIHLLESSSQMISLLENSNIKSAYCCIKILKK